MANRFSKSKGPSQRQLRAGELLRHALVEVFHKEEFRDPVLHGVSITVSEVRASPDLKNASVYCSPLGSSVIDARANEVIKVLNKHAPYIRHLLGKKVELKYTPALIFHNDDSFGEARKIDDLLSSPDVVRDLVASDKEPQ